MYMTLKITEDEVKVLLELINDQPVNLSMMDNSKFDILYNLQKKLEGLKTHGK